MSEYKLQSQLIQDFFTAICILLGNFTVLPGNFKIQMIQFDHENRQNQKNDDDNFFALIFKIPKSVFKHEIRRIATCNTVYTEVIIFFSFILFRIYENSLKICNKIFTSHIHICRFHRSQICRILYLKTLFDP